MATEYRKAPDYVLDITKRLVALHHEGLKGARIGVIMRSEAPVTGGRIVYGTAEKVSAKAQVHVPYDFIITISADRFGLLAPLQKEALIDHELCHCVWEMDKAAIRPHDIEEFTEILERYGYWWPHADDVAEAAHQAQLFEPTGAVIAIPIETAAETLRAAAERI